MADAQPQSRAKNARQLSAEEKAELLRKMGVGDDRSPLAEQQRQRPDIESFRVRAPGATVRAPMPLAPSYSGSHFVGASRNKPGGVGGANGVRAAPQVGCGPGTSSDLRNFLWGVGDVALLGFGDDLRDAVGIDPVDMNSNAYLAGEIAGSVAAVATGVGGGVRAAGAAARGLEFSHFIPKRLGGPRSILNGNFVPIRKHALTDPFRYRFMPKSWRDANDMPSRARQLWIRAPNTMKGTAAGVGVAGTGLARSGC